MRLCPIIAYDLVAEDIKVDADNNVVWLGRIHLTFEDNTQLFDFFLTLWNKVISEMPDDVVLQNHVLDSLPEVNVPIDVDVIPSYPWLNEYND
jgi:hypothetical protein